ncbi:hypothetical protein [Enterococcus cecorum]|uniref:hypothetical protein n=1 Tax=Enterococcus cecorum TaxID=44008 RepID=UPI00148DF5FD|nr:hypothetical protein [Enterococcus cecorum]
MAEALRGHFLHAVLELDIDDYFDEKWSPEFGRENYLRPSQYIKKEALTRLWVLHLFQKG